MHMKINYYIGLGLLKSSIIMQFTKEKQHVRSAGK